MSGRLDFYNYYALALTKTTPIFHQSFAPFSSHYIYFSHIHILFIFSFDSQICPILVPFLPIAMWHQANSSSVFPFNISGILPCYVKIIPPPLTFHTNLICHFVGFSFSSLPPPPFLNFFSPLWEFSTLLLTINPSSSQSCYAAVPGEICEHQAMLIHHQFSERLRNYIFFLPSKYWVSHLFVRLGGQARTRGKQPPKVSPSPQDTLQCIVCLGIIYFKTSFFVNI